jgi:hypothetical protein
MSALATTSASLAHTAIRRYSVQAARPNGKASSAIAGTLLTTAFVMPFVPQTLGNKRRREAGPPIKNPNYGPICCHS